MKINAGLGACDDDPCDHFDDCGIRCDDMGWDCCSCGGNDCGCGYCWDCHACDKCRGVDADCEGSNE